MFAQDHNILQLEQGSEKWLEYRKTRIGASDAPCIMGVGFHTPLQLWRQKLGLSEVQVTEKMQRGNELEPIAREAFCRDVGMDFYPAVVESREHPWMFASLDGLSMDQRNIVEIKCPGAKDHQLAIENKIPEKYFPQLQHQMLVLNVQCMYYYSFDGNSGKTVLVYADVQYHQELLKREKEFYRKLITFEEPELTERDYVQKTDADFLHHANEYRKLCAEEKRIEELKESHRNALIRLADQQNVAGGGIRVRQIDEKGRVDYSAIPELQNVDLERYRKPGIKKVRITEVE